MYRGPFVYRKGSGSSSLTLESAAFGGGRLTPDGALLYVTDYLGSVRAVVDGTTGQIYKAVDYSAYGDESEVMVPQQGTIPEHTLAAATLPSGMTLRDSYTGKEDQTPDFGTSYTDFGARQYSPAIRRWMTPDPLSEKYYGVSPYAFCNDNPVNFVDPDGMKILPKGVNELLMIKNTLPSNMREYIQVGSDGFIDANLINSAVVNGQGNFNSLREMVNSQSIVVVELNDKFIFHDSNGNIGEATMSYIPYDSNYPEDRDLNFENISGLSTGEMGFYGKTLFPDTAGQQNSSNGNIVIIVNSSLSPLGAAETFSHEGYGHALLYILNGGDHNGASHMPVTSENGPIDVNSVLRDMILSARKETVDNFNY